MFDSLDRFLSAQTRPRLALLVLMLVAIVGLVDHLTGYELSISIFYLVPIGIAAWYGHRRLGLAVAAVSALAWMVMDYTSGHPYSHTAILFWNAGVRLGIFIIVAVLLDRVRLALAAQAALARHDPLTGLNNARAFRAQCQVLFELAARHRRATTLAYLDIDGFKAINDRHGHDAGDEVLRAVADELASRTRDSDLAARLGGDEFAVLLPETGLDGARAYFEQLHRSLNELATRNQWPIGFSFGVAVFDAPVPAPDEAIRHADQLMYRVKQSGKNRVDIERQPAVESGKAGQR